MSDFTKRSTESNWVVDLVFELRIIVEDARNSVSTRSPQVLRGGPGSRWKGLGFSLCAAPSRLAGPHISGLGGVESRQSPGGVNDVVRDQDQRFEVRDGGGGIGGVGVGIVAKMSKLHKEK
jgi:hypothetical protein